MAEEKQPGVITTTDQTTIAELFWCWQDNMDGSYKLYEPEISLQIESLQTGESAQIKIHHRFYVIARTNKNYGYQQNLNTNFKRNTWQCTMEEFDNFNKNNHFKFYKNKTFCWCWQNNNEIWIEYKQEINDKIESLKYGKSIMITEEYKIIRNDEWNGMQENVHTSHENPLWKIDRNKLDEYNKKIINKQQTINKHCNGIYFWCWMTNNGLFAPYRKNLSQYIDTLQFGQYLHETMNKNINYKIRRNDELNGQQINLSNGRKRNIFKFEINHLNDYNIKQQQQQQRRQNNDNAIDIDMECKQNINIATNTNDMDIDNKLINPFELPSNIKIEAIFENNITMKEIFDWRSGGKYSFTLDGEYIHSAGHIAVIYHKNDKFEVVFHERAYNMRGGGKLGWPGGVADKYNESIWKSVLRELKEECMSKIGDKKHIELSEENIHLFYAKKTYHKPLHFYALFVVFVDDKSLVSGPDKHSQWEVAENKHLGMTKENGYHNFFAFDIDPITKTYEFENKEIGKMLWNVSAMRKLVKAIKFNDINV